MRRDGKLFEMLVGYAAAHQHPFNVIIHMVGIPAIMLGALIPMSWVGVNVFGVSVSLAHALITGFFVFYLTLDKLFALIFLLLASVLLVIASALAPVASATGWVYAIALFVGGYIGQFVGHAVEKSMPVLVKHPIQANLAAPFFTVVELAQFCGLRQEMFAAIKEEIERRREPDVST